MVTVQQVFDTTIHLMDEQNESNGATQTVDTNEYRYRTINILNMIIPVLWPYCAENTDRESGRELPVMLDPTPYNSPNLEQIVPVDDAFAYSVMPYFLASELLTDEDADRSERFRMRYQAAMAEIRKNQLADWEQIQNPFANFCL